VAPNYLKEDGRRYFFYSNEGHEPPHVHVRRGDDMAKFWLNAAVDLDANYGLNPSDIKRARLVIAERQREFLEKWNAHCNQ
jgi:hypothetical protein